MFEAILLFSPYSSVLHLSERKLKVKYHWVIQVLSAVCIHLGFSSIFYNKVRNGKDHFVSWHGKIGLAAVIMTTLQAVAGSSLIYYNVGLLNPGGLTLALRKKMHALVGALTFFVGYLALVTALYSKFVLQNTSEVSWYALLVLMTMLASVVVNQISSAYVVKKTE